MPGTLILFAHSFSGSTLLTHMLGEHPRVYPVGELFWRHCYMTEVASKKHPMIHRASMGGEASKHYINCERCSRVNAACPVWSTVPMKLPTEELYGSIRSALGVDWIVDSSKQHWWYEEMVRACPNERIICVCLHKSPWGWLGSKGRYEVQGFTDAGQWHLLTDEFVTQWATAWAHAMISHRDVLARHDLDFIDVRYEDLVMDWKAVVAGLFDYIDIDPQGLPTCSAISWGKQHHLGGNAKLHSMILERIRSDGEQATIPIKADPLAVGPCPEVLRPKLEAIPAVNKAMALLGRTFE